MNTAAQFPETNNNNTDRKFVVFVVDDENSRLSAMGHRLAKEYPKHLYEIHCFQNGEDCVKHMKLKPQLIIMDQFMASYGEGSLCGPKLLKAIQREDSDVPVVIIPTKSRSIDVLFCEDSDAYYMVRESGAFESVKKIVNITS